MTGSDSTFEITPATTVRRVPARASYDRATAWSILDDGLVAHVGFVSDGRPVVIPMVYGRDGDRLILHASVAGRLARTLSAGVDVCATVTHVDALVMAKSHFHHSMNYRSVVIMGTATRLTDRDDLVRALEVLVDHVVPGRSTESRPPNRTELRQTAVLALPIEHTSVKVRTGGPVDDESDLGAPVWSGVVPLVTTPAEPRPDDTSGDLPLPGSLSPWTRPGAGG